MILSKSEIYEYIKEKKLIINPFNEDTIRENGIDLRFGNEIARLKKTNLIFDPHYKNEYENFFEKENGEYFIINPDERILVCTLEYIELKGLIGFVNLRSSYARLGLSLPPTIVDTGFKGQLTLQIMGGSFPIKLYARDRFFHIILAKLTSNSVRYKGVYLDQKGVTYPKF
ncbi:MAG: dCTP deaminase [Nitrososphaerales archaeon]